MSVRTLLIALSLAGLSFGAQAADLTIGYITGIDPTKLAQAEDSYDKAIGEKIDWRRFDSGPAVVSALASGDLQIGNLGSSPLAAAASRNVPLVTFIVTAQIKVVNLSPAQITAAWKRGDIDGAFTWSPALGEIRKTGKILTDAGQVSEWGAPTFEVWVARKDFADKHPEIVAKFAEVSLNAIADYNAHQAAWTTDSPQVQTIARLTGASPEDIPELLQGAHFPSTAEQKSAQLLGGGTAKDIAGTALFLKDQGKIEGVLPDYSSYVSDKFLPK